MSAELRAVLFDMDGTLVDTERLWWEACAAVAAELGLKLTEADTLDVLGRSIEHAAGHLVRRARTATDEATTRPGGTSVGRTDAHPGETSAGKTETRHSGTFAGQIGVRLTEAFAERIAEGVTPLPGAIRLLDDLRTEGMPTALVSASPRQIVDMVLRTVGAERFTLIVAAEDTARAKPLPDPYLKAAADLGVDPSECVAVEDSPAGIAAARAAGCRVVAVPGDMAAPYDVSTLDSLERVSTAAPYDVLTVGSLEQVNMPLLRLLAEGEPR